MAKPQLRKMVVTGDHLVAPDSGPPWTVHWDTAMRADGNWSIVRTINETVALERAAHFLKLGFIVHAIRDPSGTIVMNAGEITRRLGSAEDKSADRASPVASTTTTEQSAHDILRGFVDDYQATPGRMLAAATLHALLSPHGVTRIQFDRAVGYAKDHGWLSVTNGVLTLTQAGHAAASTGVVQRGK
jgi:hypothetical protein